MSLLVLDEHLPSELVEPGFPKDAALEAELLGGLPFVTMDLVRQDLFDAYVNDVFATDRRDVPKGMVEIVL